MDIKKHSLLPRIDKIVLGFIIIIAFLFRLYNINVPLADIHSWRQADTAAVARNFERYGFDLMHPRYDDVSSNQTGYENPQGYRMVEFPIYNSLFAGLHTLFPALSLDVWGRLTTIFFSLIIIFVLYAITLHEENRTTAIVASLTYAVFPFFVFFSRVILPETTALSFSMMSIFFLYISHRSNAKIWMIACYILSFVAFALALLAKPPVIFYAIALTALFLRRYGRRIFTSIPFYIYFVCSAIPLIAWRYYIRGYPEGIPASDWLITSVNTYEGMKNIFFKPAFFRWIFYERMSNIVLGGYLTAFLILGFLAKSKTTWFWSMVLSAGTYLFVFQGGNVQHEYYQTLILPAVAIAVGRGVSYISSHKQSLTNPIVIWTVCILVWIASFLFSFYRIQEFYRYPTDLVQIARVISSLTNKNDLIVTDRLGDTTLLYLADRRGAPSKYRSLEELKALGYSYYVTQNKEEIAILKEQDPYKNQVVFENTQGDIFALFKL